MTWTYIQLAQPTGLITDPLALWQFDGTVNNLLDRTPNSHNLTRFRGSYDIIANTATLDQVSFIGLGFNAGTGYYDAVNSAGFRITGALTMEVLYLPYSHYASGASIDRFFIAGCVGDPVSELEAQNYLYSFSFRGFSHRYYYLAERTASGTDIAVTFDPGPTRMGIEHICFVRDGSGNLSLIQNGVLVDTQTALVPTGGTSDYFRLGSETASSTYAFGGVIYAIKITAAAYTEAMGLKAYRRVRGL